MVTFIAIEITNAQGDHLRKTQNWNWKLWLHVLHKVERRVECNPPVSTLREFQILFVFPQRRVRSRAKMSKSSVPFQQIRRLTLSMMTQTWLASLFRCWLRLASHWCGGLPEISDPCLETGYLGGKKNLTAHKTRRVACFLGSFIHTLVLRIYIFPTTLHSLALESDSYLLPLSLHSLQREVRWTKSLNA